MKRALLVMAALMCCCFIAPAQTRIMPLGDSTTWGFNTPGGYRDPLAQSLANDGWVFQFVGSQGATQNGSTALIAADQAAHEGHNGYRIEDITANIPGDDGKPDSNGGHWLNGPDAPRVILLHIGTNDILHQSEIPSMGDRLATLLDTIFTALPEVQVILATIIPIDTLGRNPDVVNFNSLIQSSIVPAQLALGRKLFLVDQYANFVDAEGAIISARLPGDGIHPDAIGYSAMATTWAAALEAILPQTFAQWQAAHFDAAQMASEEISGPAADWDGDGLSTLFEWFHHRDPLVADSQGAEPSITQPAIEMEGSSRYLTLTWRQSNRLEGATAQWETSPNLEPASWTMFGPVVVPLEADTDGTPRYSIRLEINGSEEAFLRLHLVLSE